MKPKLETAPEHIQQNFEHLLKNAGYLHAVDFAVTNDFDPPPPETPILDALRKHIERGDFAAINQIRHLNSDKVTTEEYALDRYNGLRRWAATPSVSEIRAEQAIAKAAHDKQAAIERRALEIVALEEQKIREKAIEAAMKKARQEAERG